jgi:hypothetical protein
LNYQNTGLVAAQLAAAWAAVAVVAVAARWLRRLWPRGRMAVAVAAGGCMAVEADASIGTSVSIINERTSRKIITEYEREQ